MNRRGAGGRRPRLSRMPNDLGSRPCGLIWRRGSTTQRVAPSAPLRRWPPSRQSWGDKRSVPPRGLSRPPSCEMSSWARVGASRGSSGLRLNSGRRCPQAPHARGSWRLGARSSRSGWQPPRARARRVLGAGRGGSPLLERLPCGFSGSRDRLRPGPDRSLDAPQGRPGWVPPRLTRAPQGANVSCSPTVKLLVGVGFVSRCQSWKFQVSPGCGATAGLTGMEATPRSREKVPAPSVWPTRAV